MLHVTKEDKDLDLCIKNLSDYFKETWDYCKQDLFEDNIYVLTNETNTCFFILRNENDYLHYDFGFVNSNFRGNGIGTKAITEIIDFGRQFNKSIRATVRLENIASYKTMFNNGFLVNNTFVIGSSIGVEMIYNYPRTIDIKKYISNKPSSCGLFVLSALSDLKYNNYIAPDELNVPCIPNYGIQKETMIQCIMSVFKEYNFKVVSNYTDDTEDVFHLIKQWFVKPNHFAIACIKTDKMYDHWILIKNYNGVHFNCIDSEYKEKDWTKYELFSKMIQSNMFTILI